MKCRKVMTAVMTVLLGASFLMAQTNARTNALGNPNVNGRNLIDDVSDVFYFPSEVVNSTDMVQGVAGSYVYLSMSQLSPLYMGFLLSKANYSASSGFFPGLNGAIAGAEGYTFETGPTAMPLAPGYGVPGARFDIAPINTPPGVAHLLLGMGLGDIMKLGLDISYERANTDVDSTGVDVVGLAPNTQTTTVKGLGSTTFSGIGVNAGVQADLALLKIKGSVGFVMLGVDAEMEHSGNYVDAVVPGNNLTYNTEKSTLKSSSGSYIPVSVKASMDVGPNALTLGGNLDMTSYQYEATYDDGDAGTPPLQSYKSDEVSITTLGVGLADAFAVTEATKLIAALAFERSSMNTKPTTVSEINREITTTTTTLPFFSLGMEHVEKAVWKFDQVSLRAGGNKAISWTSEEQTGGTASSKVSNSQAAAPNWGWMTGVALNMGNFELAMTVAAGNWNGVYFLTGTGPAGANVTLTYNWGGSSSSSSSSSESMPSATPTTTIP